MIERVRENLLKAGIAEQDLVVGVSGGVDSVVLLDVLMKDFRDLFGNLTVAHLNHCLRGDESDGDEAFVKNLADQYGVGFVSKSVNVGEIPGNLEANGRVERYGFFEEVGSEVGANWVLTAHHANDSYETVVMNVQRGCGLRGMRGIGLCGESGILRPFFNIKKKSLVELAQSRGLKWRDDASNSDLSFRRNYVRRFLVDDSLVDEFLNDRESVVKELEQINGEIDRILDGDRFELEEFFGLSDRMKSELVVRAYEQKNGSTESLVAGHVEEVVGFLSSGVSGRKKRLCRGWNLVIDFGVVSLVELGDEVEEYVESGVRAVQKCDDFVWNGYKVRVRLLQKGEEVEVGAMVCDYEKLSGGISCRGWQKGDAFRPFGMKGKSKKLQDFFVDRRISVYERCRLPVFLDGDGEIFCVGSVEIGDAYKLTEDTVEVLAIYVDSAL